jgi:mono/diheme cytochrome c family protein
VGIERGVLTAGVIGAVVLGACSSSDPAGSRSDRRAPKRFERATLGERVYESRCAACHGAVGRGNVGPSLVGVARRLTAAEQYAVVERGRGTMPPLGAALGDAEVAAVVAYTRDAFR